MENFKGYIRIPNEVKKDNRLTPLSRLIYGDIISLSSSSGCYAGNTYFSKVYGCSSKTISRAIKQLEDYCYIEIQNKNNSKRFIKPLVLIEGGTKMSKYKDKKVSHNKINKKGFIEVDVEKIYV